MRQLFKKVGACAFAFGALLAALPLSAQVGTNYTFSQSTGSYTPITGGTLLATHTGFAAGVNSMDDVIYNIAGGTIPFTFTFDGVGYTGCNVSSNGFITFGATAPTATTYQPISAATAYAGAISAFGRDVQGGFAFNATRTLGSNQLTLVTSTGPLVVGDFVTGTGIPVGATITAIAPGTITMSANATSTLANATFQGGGATWSNIRFETLGSSPNQVFVIQWSGFKRFGTTGTTVQHMELNFQIRLYEVDNAVEVIYGNCTPGLTTLTTVNAAGLRGPTNAFPANVNSRQNTKGVNDNWNASVAATAAANGMVFNNVAPANVIGSGLTYRWFDPPCTAPTANVTTAANCATNQYTATVNVVSVGDAPNVNIVSSIHGTIATAVGVGAHPSNPNAFGTPESFTVVHNGNALCNISLGPVNFVDNDNTCFPTNTSHPVSSTFPITNVPFCISDPGTSLGTDVFVQSVDLIIAHTWNDDMDIQLINPNGTIVNLVNDRFGSGDNLGNPALCPGGLFTLAAGGAALTITNTSNVVGTYTPEQPLTTLHDASNPNGQWTLRITDDTGGDDGGVRFVRVNLTACPDPVVASNSAVTPNCATGQYTFNVNVTDAGPSTVDITTDAHGLIHSGVGVGLWAVPATAFGTPVTVTVTSTSIPACTTTLPAVNYIDADVTCHPATTFPIPDPGVRNVPFCVSHPGTALGTDAFVQSVDLIISHTWNNDLDIQLLNPNGTIVNLVFDRFGSGDNLGNPTLCPGGLFTLAAGGAALSVANTSNVVGTFTPEQPLSTLHDASNPNGLWTLRVTDDTGADVGAVRYVGVNLVSCQSPTATTSIVPNCAGANNDFSVDVTITSMGSATSIDIDPSVGSTVTAGAPGVYTVGPFVSGSSVTIDLVHNLDVTCNVTLGPLSFTCPPDNDACANAIAVACNSVTGGTTVASTIDAVPTCNTTLNTAGGVWYTFVGTGGNTTVSMCGSNYDTKVGVFTTPDCAVFTCIEGNDDDTDVNGLDVCSNNLHSSMEFPSVLGQTYYVLVTGFSTFTGNFILEITCAGDGACNDNGVVVEIRTDNFGSQTSWEIVPVGNTIAVCSGSGYPDNATVQANCCLIDGCYVMSFFDSFGDGMSLSTPAGQGGYRLFNDAGKRIIDNWTDGTDFDNPTGGSNSTQQNGFCVPIGAYQLTVATCDKENYTINDVIVSGIDPVVSADYPNPLSGYQFWVYNPDGGYSRRLYRAHGATSCIGTPSGPTLAAHLKLSCLNGSAPFLPCDTLLNVRVRSRQNGVYGEFGPACRLRMPCTPVACPTTQLDNNPLNAGTTLSCGVSGKTVGASGYAGKLYPNIVAGANKYQYEFIQAGESYSRTIATPTGSYALTLANWVTNPLICGTFTYDVRVRASFDGGANYCPYGPVCTVEITNNPPNNCTAPFQSGGGTSSILADDAGMALSPNPTRNGNVSLALNGLSTEVMTATVDIFDVFGKKVSTNTLATDGAEALTTVLNLKDMATGMYTVNVTSGTQTFTSRLVVE